MMITTGHSPYMVLVIVSDCRFAIALQTLCMTLCTRRLSLGLS